MSKEALKKKITGSVVVELDVNTEGKPENIHVIRGLGYGLDEQAIFSAQKYIFQTRNHEG